MADLALTLQNSSSYHHHRDATHSPIFPDDAPDSQGYKKNDVKKNIHVASLLLTQLE